MFPGENLDAMESSRPVTFDLAGQPDQLWKATADLDDLLQAMLPSVLHQLALLGRVGVDLVEQRPSSGR